VVASEDGHFWMHRGFDWSGICAAAKSNAAGKRLRGGSTITQQVARNVFLVQHRSWVRKGLEAWYTVWLELLVPKERILELYLNIAESGPHHFGFQAAARHWYGKPAIDLSRDQGARLVALLPNPRERTPVGDLGAKKAAWVLQNEVPFPGDPGFDRAAALWKAADGPLSCW
jgi:monofunctional glycosyltransferase